MIKNDGTEEFTKMAIENTEMEFTLRILYRLETDIAMIGRLPFTTDEERDQLLISRNALYSVRERISSRVRAFR